MFGFLKRLFRIGSAEANAALDKLENPINMTQEGIRKLQKDLDDGIKNLAEVRAIAIRTRREAEQQKQTAADYEVKARMLLQKAKDGSMPLADAQRLAGEALARKDEVLNQLRVSTENAVKYENMANNLQGKINQLKSQISTWENELRTLKARHKVSTATTKINKELANIDSNDTISMLERMKEKVEQQEALAESYGELANVEKSIDAEINKALEGTRSNESLDALMIEMGMKEKPLELPPMPEKLLEENKDNNPPA